MAMRTGDLRQIDGGVTAARGFRAAGIRCGIKPAGKDLALVAADSLATVAAAFTTNAVRAAPVLLSQERVQSGAAQAIVVNSGNANACTGAQGLADAREMAALVARALGVAEEFVLVASTGVIGVPLPMPAIREGIPALVAALSGDGADAAEAICTTDAFPKTAAVQVEIAGAAVTVGGMAKGAGMIHPQLATTLGFLTTDAAVSAPMLRAALRRAIAASWNSISVDGDTSTNDSVFLLASGLAGNAPITEEGEAFARFAAALTAVAVALAKMVVADGEGATKTVTVRVRGARSAADAVAAARTIATSPLVKTMLYGAEPNWGRLMAALGRSGAEVREDRVAIWIAGVPVVRDGIAAGGDLRPAAAGMRAREYEITIDLGLGPAEHTAWMCDLNESYVKVNAGYLS